VSFDAERRQDSEKKHAAASTKGEKGLAKEKSGQS
jgi:hypothetical protein